ncbi:MAG: hypothetical protein ACR2OY_00745, partial [Boseongicola sp.]
MSDNDPFEIRPSFPEILDREVAFLSQSKVPTRQKMIAWIGIIAVMVSANLIAGALFPETLGISHLVAFLLGATVFAAYAFVVTRQVLAVGSGMQKSARERSRPIVFRFTPKRFVIETSNGRTDYVWDAVDDVETMSIGIG